MIDKENNREVKFTRYIYSIYLLFIHNFCLDADPARGRPLLRGGTSGEEKQHQE